jgi:ATP-dependent DNA helicase RecG
VAVTTLDLNPTDIARLLKLEEGHFIDAKAKEVTPAKLTKTIAAFANADGGELYIGLLEDKATNTFTWNGFATVEAANSHLQVFEDLFPLGQDFQYEFLSAGALGPGYVLRVQIQKTREIKVASDGKVYVRRGAQSLPVAEGDALERLRRNKGLSSFETNTVDVPTDFITESSVLETFVDSVVPQTEPVRFLRKQLLIRDDKPTVAAVLLFSDEPQAALPKRCAIKIYRYKTTDTEGSRANLAFDPITIEGCLYDQIDASVKRAVEVVQEVRLLTSSGLEPIAYPLETLHEIITNAVLHRDYGIADDVHVRIFDNRVEVESPGRLPAHITTANILDERFARNGTVVRLINKFPNPPNKDVGEGLNTAFAAMKKLELRDPVIRESENAVIVEIRHQKLGSPEQIIMDFLERNPQITNRQVRELTGIGSENKVKNVFLRLAAANQIERVPNRGGGSAAWQKVNP